MSNQRSIIYFKLISFFIKNETVRVSVFIQHLLEMSPKKHLQCLISKGPSSTYECRSPGAFLKTSGKMSFFVREEYLSYLFLTPLDEKISLPRPPFWLSLIAVVNASLYKLYMSVSIRRYELYLRGYINYPTPFNRNSKQYKAVISDVFAQSLKLH